MTRLLLPTAAAVILVAVAGCQAPETPMSGPDLVRAMHERYAGVRPGSLTFVQTTILHRPDAEPDTSIWYEAAVPGRLRIDFAPLENGNGALYDGGWLHVVRGGRVVRSRPEVNALMVLLMDIYQVDPARTVETLDTLGYDLSTIRKGEWEGRPVWIVGADESDDSSSQFWVDEERLVTVRVIHPIGGRTSTFDVRIVGHRIMDGYPQEDAILMYMDGRLYQEEYYDDIRAGQPIDPAVFDTSAWMAGSGYRDSESGQGVR